MRSPLFKVASAPLSTVKVHDSWADGSASAAFSVMVGAKVPSPPWTMKLAVGLRGFNEGRHVGTAAGDEHGDAFAAHGLTKIKKAIINYTLIAGFRSYFPEHYN